MKNWTKIGVAMILGAAGLAGSANAANRTSPIPASRFRPQAKPPKAVIHKLDATVINYGAASSIALPGGLVLVDSVSVNCKSSSGCTIENLMASQVGGNSTAGNLWAICGEVDGSFMNPACPYQGQIPADGSYPSGFASQSYTVATGKHTLATYVYTSAAAVLGNWQTTYNIYIP